MPEHDMPKMLFGTPGFALPMMRGFACPVSTPALPGMDAPMNGLGVGWSNVMGHGITFFVSLHGQDGLTLMAELDYARYVRLCQNLAACGQQAKLIEKVDKKIADPLEALGECYSALEAARGQFDKAEREERFKANKEKDPDLKGKWIARAAVNRDLARDMDAAIQKAGAALMIVTAKGDDDDGEA